MSAQISISHIGWHVARRGCVAVFFGGLLATNISAEPELAYDERLLPVATTYLDLILCANFADEFENNEKLFDRYSTPAWALDDSVDELGWHGDEFVRAIMAAQERLALLEITKHDTRESFKRRHWLGKPCEAALKRAKSFAEKGLPAPLAVGN